MAYEPENTQRLRRATRFFARVERATLECPKCGTVYQISARVKSANFDPMTARFHCTTDGCKRSYVIGIVAWPIIAAPKVASATPMDQVPNERQLAALRKEGAGWWLADEAGQRYARPYETNLTTEEDRPDDDDEDT